MVDSVVCKKIADMLNDSLEEKIYVLKNKIKHNNDSGDEEHLKNKSFHIEDMLTAIEMCDSDLITVGKKVNLTYEEAQEKANAYFMLQMKYDFLLEKVLVFIDATIMSDSLEVQKRKNEINEEETNSSTNCMDGKDYCSTNDIETSMKSKDINEEYLKSSKRKLDEKLNNSLKEHNENKVTKIAREESVMEQCVQNDIYRSDQYLYSKQNNLAQSDMKQSDTFPTNEISNETQSIYQADILDIDNDIIKTTFLNFEMENSENEINESEGFYREIQNSNKITEGQQESNLVNFDDKLIENIDPLTFLETEGNENVVQSNFTDERQITNETDNLTNSLKIGSNTTPNLNMEKHPEHHTEKICYNCEKCGKSYAQNKSAQKHNITCTGPDKDKQNKRRERDNGNVFCPYCFKPLSDSRLKRHIEAVHFQIKHWNCDKCEKKFYEKTDLRRHHERHHEPERPEHYKRPKTSYNCGKCGKSYSQNKSAQIHINACTGPEGQKPVCTICKHALSDNWSMKRHMESHLKVKKQRPPPHCNECDLPFTTYNKLKKHRIIKHDEQVNKLGTENIKCEVDGCTFKHHKLSFVKSHMTRNHGKKDKIQCTICPFQCFSNRGMNGHQKSVHTVFIGYSPVLTQDTPSHMVKLECDTPSHMVKLECDIKEDHMVKLECDIKEDEG